MSSREASNVRRAVNILRRLRLHTVEDIRAYGPLKLLQAGNVGPKCVAVIEEAIGGWGERRPSWREGLRKREPWVYVPSIADKSPGGIYAELELKRLQSLPILGEDE